MPLALQVTLGIGIWKMEGVLRWTLETLALKWWVNASLDNSGSFLGRNVNGINRGQLSSEAFLPPVLKGNGGDDNLHRYPWFSKGNPSTLNPKHILSVPRHWVWHEKTNTVLSQISASTLFLKMPHSLSGNTEPT